MKWSRRQLMIGLSSAILQPKAVEARPRHANSALFKPLALGAGGWITGLDVHSDGTLICRTDTYGCYRGKVTAGTRWQQMLTIASMPKFSVGFDATGNFVPGIGVYEIRLAPSNSSIFYMLYSDNVSQTRLSLFKSTDSGTTWTRLKFPDVTWAPGTENDNYRMTGQKMAVHPTDPNTVLIGTPSGGVYYTVDGGSNFAHISGIAASKPDGNNIHPGITGLCFDPAMPDTCYAASFGSGVYRSTTGVAGAWSLLSGSPQYVTAAVVHTGSYWCIGKTSSVGIAGGSGFANALFKFDGTSFSTNGLKPDGNGLQSICFVSPSTIICTTSAGSLWVSTNTGITWSGTSYAMPIQSPADIPWLAKTSHTFFSAGGLAADPLTSGRVIQGMGIGVIAVNMTWSMYSYATTTPWISHTDGIEQLVARKIISPPGGKPLVAVEDRGVFSIEDPAAYPFDYSTRPISRAGTCASWDVDYAKSSPSTVGEVSNTLSTDVSGLSRSYGQPGTWSTFPTNPNPSAYRNGNIAISTPTNTLFFNIVNEAAPKYTTDGGATWKTSAGLPTTGWSPANPFNNNKIICADDAGNGTFYAVNSNGNIYRSTDGGANFAATPILTGIVPRSFYQPMLMSVPGQAGHIFFAPGINQAANLPVGNALYRSKNSNGGSPTLTAVSNVLDVWAIGFGAVVPGQNYPTVWIAGFVKVGAAPYRYGIWGSKDNCITWTFLIDYPFDSCDQIVTISGDSNDPTRCYFGFQGSGAGYGFDLGL